MARLPVSLISLLLASSVLLAQDYFPLGALGKDAASHQFSVDWYSKHLKALHEPSLWELSRKDPHAEVYRFLWLRSFDHPMAVRLVIRSSGSGASGSGWMNSRMTSGQGGLEPGRITRYNVFLLTKAKTQEFLNALESANFWNLPALPEANEEEVHLDGAQWIVEGVRNGQYHVVDRWSPEKGDPVREFGLVALKLGRFKIRSGELY
jgi:hypothetical protein